MRRAAVTAGFSDEAGLIAGESACRAKEPTANGTGGTRGTAGATVAHQLAAAAAATTTGADQEVPAAVGQAGAVSAGPAVSAVRIIGTARDREGAPIPARTSGEVCADVDMEPLLGRHGDRRGDL